MPPKPQKKTPKKTNITRPSPGGVKKRGESTAYRRRTKGPEPPPGSRGHLQRDHVSIATSRKVRDTVMVIRSLVKSFKRLDDFMQVHKLYYTRVPVQTKRLTIARESKELRGLLDAAFHAIDMVDTEAIKVPILAFHHETRGKKRYTPLTVKEVKEFVNSYDISNRKYYEGLKSAGKNWFLQEYDFGFEESYVVPFYTLRELIKLGYLETLTPLRRDLFTIHFNWVNTHTSPIIKKYMSGSTYNNTSIAKISGTTYTPNLFRGSVPINATAASRKRTR